MRWPKYITFACALSLIVVLSRCKQVKDLIKPDLSIPKIVNPVNFNNGFTSGIITLDNQLREVVKGPYFNGTTYSCNTFFNVPISFTGNIFLQNEFYSITRKEFVSQLNRDANVTYVWNTFNFPYQICFDSLKVGEEITVYKVITNTGLNEGNYSGNGSKTLTKLIRVKDGKIEEQKSSQPTLIVPAQQFRVIKSTFNYKGPGDFIHTVIIDENNKIDEENEGNNSQSDTTKGLIVR